MRYLPAPALQQCNTEKSNKAKENANKNISGNAFVTLHKSILMLIRLKQI
jgi:hypothetical protein